MWEGLHLIAQDADIVVLPQTTLGDIFDINSYEKDSGADAWTCPQSDVHLNDGTIIRQHDDSNAWFASVINCHLSKRPTADCMSIVVTPLALTSSIRRGFTDSHNIDIKKYKIGSN